MPASVSTFWISSDTVEPPQLLPSPPHTPHSSFSKVEPHSLSQPDGPASPQPQPASTLPSQSHAPSAIPSPPHTPHSSFSNVEPQVSSHPEGPGSPQPQPASTLPSQSHAPSAIPPPPHTPHYSQNSLKQ